MTLPKEIRKALGVVKGGVIMAEVGEEGIVLHPAVAYPIEMYTAKRVAEFDEADRKLAARMKRR